ncbi:type IV toxin-antitoxin system AbiEi family antitoxin domain-containing protein [Intrasporangium mesophilum]
MVAKTKYRAVVREIALDQYGYVTTKQAAEAGVPAVELPKLAARGGLKNVAYGIYRVPDAPASVFDQFAEALLRAGEGSYLHGDSVLALFGLADVNPRRIRVAVRKRTRPKLPPYIELTLVKGDVVTTLYEGLESQRVADAILECRGRVERSRLMEAAEEARKEGLMTAKEWRQVSKELRS